MTPQFGCQISMPYFTRVQRRHWSLSLMVILLLHWAGGAMAAEVLCFEPDGKVVLEDAGHPCQEAAAEKAFGNPFIDLKVDNQESHAVAPANPAPHADLQPLAFIPVLFY